MKTDAYTKFILTVIALCLLWISLAVPRSVKAAQEEQHIVISGIEIPRKSLGGLPVYMTDSVEVEGCK